MPTSLSAPLLAVFFCLCLVPSWQQRPSPGECSLAMQYTGNLLTSGRRVHAAALLMPAGRADYALQQDGSCAYKISDLLPLATSAGKISLIDPVSCLADVASCRRRLDRVARLVIHLQGDDSMERICVQLLSHRSEWLKQLKVTFIVLERQWRRFRELVDRLDVNLATDFSVALLNNSEILVSEFYRKCDACRLTFHMTYRWWNGSARVLDGRIKEHRRMDLGGITLNAVGVKIFPIYTEVATVNNRTVPVGGVFYLVAKALSRLLNFRLNITLLDGYNYGGRLADGSYTGMVGALQSRAADLTVSEVSVTDERRSVIDFTQILSEISRSLYLRIETAEHSWISRYRRGISPLMTALLFLSVALTAAVLSFCECRSPGSKCSTGPGGAGLSRWRDAFLIILGAALQQGSPLEPVALSSRIAMLTGLVLGVLIYTAYSATLVSFLAAADVAAPPFPDLQGLLEVGQGWQAGWKRGDLVENFLDWCALTDSPLQDCTTMTAVRDRVTRPVDSLVTSYDQGFKRVVAGQYVFIASNEAGDYWLSQMDPAIACQVHKLDVSYIPGGIAIGLQKFSPYRELFNHGIKLLTESGVIMKLYKNVLQSRRTCYSEPFVEASLEQTMGAFAILAIGGATSAAVLIIEVASVRCRRRNRSRRWQSRAEEETSGGVAGADGSPPDRRREPVQFQLPTGRGLPPVKIRRQRATPEYGAKPLSRGIQFEPTW